MKSYSKQWPTVPTCQRKEAALRRKEFLAPSWRGLCRGLIPYTRPDGTPVTQLHADQATIQDSARALGATAYLWFSGSLEAYLDGAPFTETLVEPIPA